jgi:hypothetical protein
MTNNLRPRAIGARIEGGYDNTLCCPICGDVYLHSGSVRIWNRDEDQNPAPLIAFDEATGGVTMDIVSQENNPSPRRHAIEIDFQCEGCGMAQRTLRLVQHKGVTEMTWRVSSDRGDGK